jgi:hypothetical protein
MRRQKNRQVGENEFRCAGCNNVFKLHRGRWARFDDYRKVMVCQLCEGMEFHYQEVTKSEEACDVCFKK